MPTIHTYRQIDNRPLRPNPGHLHIFAPRTKVLPSPSSLHFYTLLFFSSASFFSYTRLWWNPKRDGRTNGQSGRSVGGGKRVDFCTHRSRCGERIGRGSFRLALPATATSMAPHIVWADITCGERASEPASNLPTYLPTSPLWRESWLVLDFAAAVHSA
ncbi:hypothetical protein GGS23DRAFT_544834 [Durotheca rogersii]|uniref:uncharacterized protein n=1 Tax=Durotheca rogersii TaxID=419775 RepID=UPI00221FABB7|nr:uncharacterized protein GGS23DRAFT_544834 [Durotheca rogersii]KAI5868295.1 hypothetical protein GGS23DRAFT_544834 [Durotheca rogersii]